MQLGVTGRVECNKRGGRRNYMVMVETSVGHNDVFGFCVCDRNLVWSLAKRFMEKAEDATSRQGLFKRRFPESHRLLWYRATLLSEKIGRGFRGITPMSEVDVLKSCTARQRPNYLKGFEKGREFSASWGVIDPFIKWEKYSYYDKPDRIPRPIQPRSLMYRARLAQYMKPMEHAMLHMVLPGCHYPFLAKGKSSLRLASMFLEMASRFRNPVVLALDQSAFDGHISTCLKKLENRAFRQMQVKDQLLHRLLQVQERKLSTVRIGGKKHSLRFNGRCSGDPQTGCGNSLIMAVTCRAIFENDFELYVNGDDTNVIMEAEDLDYALASISKFDAFGLNCRVEGVFRDMEKVFWCQCYLTQCIDGWRWIRNWQRVLDTILINEEYSKLNWRNLMKGIAIGEASTNPGQPIISPVCEYIVNWNLKVHKLGKPIPTYQRWELEGCPSSGALCFEVTAQSRFLFEERYGISPSEQISMEKRVIEALSRVESRATFEWLTTSHPYGWGR